MKVVSCYKCNRVKVNDGEWSQEPSSTVSNDKERVTEICTQCEEDGVAREAMRSAGKIVKKQKDRQIRAAAEVDLSGATDLTDIARNHHTKVLDQKRLVGDSLESFASLLLESKKNGYYSVISGNDDWNSYLENDVKIEPSRARRLIAMARVKPAINKQLGLESGIDELSEYKICRQIVPCIEMDEKKEVIKNIDDISEIIGKAKELSDEEFKSEIKNYRDSRSSGGKKKKATPEILLNIGPLKNLNGDIIGEVTSVYATKEKQVLKIELDNGYITDDLRVKF